MYKFARYFAVAIAITMVFLANTVNVAFSPIMLREAESTEEFSADKNSILNPTQLNNSFHSRSEKIDNRKPESSFQNLWGLDAFNKDTHFNGIKERSDFACFDDDSAELVIGVNNANLEAYAKLVDEINSNRGKIVNTVSIEGKIIAVVADIPWNAISSFAEKVQKSGLARYVEPNMKFQAQFVPNDPYWNLQWGPQIIEADYAWNTTTSDSSTLVAVIDTGIDYDHPDLEGNYVGLGYDWVNDDAYPLDDNGHGTHCAGIIAAVLNNTVGIAGIANISIMAEKGLDDYGSGWEDDLANAIIHAVNQSANILSNSWGDYGKSFLIHDALQYAYNHGVLVIGAAGNEAISRKLYPAAYDEVVAVTATDSYDSPAWFTNFGDWVEVAAPGVDIYSTMPTYHVTLNDPPYNKNLNYDYLSGTSMACPHVVGVAALIWSQFANATRDWIRTQLRYTGDDLGDPGFDKYYGYGRINAKNAVEQAPPEHDLLIFDWEKPPYVKLGELAIFNITVLNFGVSNETDVEVHLLVNGSSIDSTSIALLPRSVSTTVGLSWTPTTRGTYNVTYYVAPVAGETIIQNNLIAEIVTVIAPPPETNWILLATDPDEGVGINLKSIYGQTYSDIIYFKVEYHRSWTTINDIDTAILIDADQDVGTGLPDGTYPSQDTGIGADYLIVVGLEATEMWKWDPIAEMWDLDNPISLAYLDAPEDSNAFVVGVFFADVETTGIIDCAVADIPSNWDWMPDSGHFTWVVIRYEHELAVLLENPQYLQPEENSLLNATVCNRGLNNETNVEIQLIINGTEVASETLDELVNGTCYTINYSWTPTAEGIYNITAYAPPVPDENVTINNIYSKLVLVQYAPRILAYAQYTDYYQDYPNTLKAIESAFGPNYILTELLDYTQLDSMLPGQDILLIPDQEYASLYTMEMIGAEWSETLTEFLENGGIIILCDGCYGYGGTYGILTGAELMSISSANYRSYYRLYLVDPSDPLAEAVSSSFVSPDYTVSFVTEETNVVIEDEWYYPVVIHKEICRGHISLLGFDFESSNADTEQLLGNAVSLAAYIPISANPSAGSPGTKVTVTGTKATANGTVSIYWDSTFMGNSTANEVGYFTYLIEVPSETTIGVHEIIAMDVATSRTGSTIFRVILIALNPTEGPIGTNVTANGAGFAPESQVTVTFNDMLIGYTIIDSFGNFTFTFNTPLSTADKYYIKALDAEGNYACEKFTVIDVTQLDVQIDVGTMHFKGEIAEFYAQTAFKGQAVNVTIINAMLYKPNRTTRVLIAQQINTGVYKIPYNITDAETGTYMLVVTASYDTDTIRARGTCLKCFLMSEKITNAVLTIETINNDIAEILIPNLGMVKANLTSINTTLININGTVAWIQTSLGPAITDIQTINATLIHINGTVADMKTTIGIIQVNIDDIQLKVTAINGTTAIIQTSLGVMNGTITSMKGDVATIVTPIGQIQKDISSLKGTQETWIIPQSVILVIVLIAAATSTMSVTLLRRKKTTKTE